MDVQMRIQLWSYNYDPEPTGIGPVSAVFAREMARRGHLVEAVCAHPHYPDRRWGRGLRPYREVRDGIPLLRLPLWIGRETASQRYRQELSFALAQLAAVPSLGAADAVVSVSPCFPALVPAIFNARLRSAAWVLWLQDILPDGASSAGITENGAILRAARQLELASYRRADRIVVISNSFAQNLARKGVDEAKVEVLYNPSTRSPGELARPASTNGPLRVLSMGNVGHSQGLERLVEAFERADLGGRKIELVITGTGVAEEAVRSQIRSPRTRMLGLVDDRQLEHELRRADLALVSQRHGGVEFNVPSKLMNFMAYGLPILAVVASGSEVHRIVEEAGGGWVVDPDDPGEFVDRLRRIADDRSHLPRCGEAASRYAREHFDARAFGDSFERLLGDLRQR